MAKNVSRFSVTEGTDELSQQLKRLSNITTDDVYTILTPAAELLVNRFKAAIDRLFKQHTGKLKNQVQIFRKKSDDASACIDVYPAGPHHMYRTHKVRGRKRLKGRTRGTATATANEVAFVLEYGAPGRGIPATHWMEKTIEASSDAVAEAMEQGLDEVLESKGVDL